MAQITNYATLQTEVANVLNRDDLTSDIPGFIQSAEARLKDDERAALLAIVDPFTASTATTALPSDYDRIESLVHAGPTYFNDIDIVDHDDLGDDFGRFGTSGAPVAAAVIGTDSPTLRWAPSPDASYDLHLVYWAKLTPLSTASPTNRLLARRPDIYLYAALAESAPFLKNDARLATWEGVLETRLDMLHEATQRALNSGPTPQRRPSRRF